MIGLLRQAVYRCCSILWINAVFLALTGWADDANLAAAKGEVAVADIKAKFVSGAFRVLQSPPVVRFFRDERTVKLVIGGMNVPARCKAMLHKSGQSLARVLGLVTVQDLKDAEGAMVHRLRKATEHEEHEG